MITIVDYGSGNIRAIANIYERRRIPYQVVDNATALKEAEKIILPGVGAFDKTMQKLNHSGLRAVLDTMVLEKGVPVLGICVGMQIMAEYGEEGGEKGLGWIKGRVKKIDIEKIEHKPGIPHLGWNSVRLTETNPLFDGIDQEVGFYFLHSYIFHPEQEVNIMCSSVYGQRFASGVCKKQIYGVQFHPEKSHRNGIELLRNFAKL